MKEQGRKATLRQLNAEIREAIQRVAKNTTAEAFMKNGEVRVAVTRDGKTKVMGPCEYGLNKFMLSDPTIKIGKKEISVYLPMVLLGNSMFKQRADLWIYKSLAGFGIIWFIIQLIQKGIIF